MNRFRLVFEVERSHDGFIVTEKRLNMGGCGHDLVTALLDFGETFASVYSSLVQDETKLTPDANDQLARMDRFRHGGTP